MEYFPLYVPCRPKRGFALALQSDIDIRILPLAGNTQQNVTLSQSADAQNKKTNTSPGGGNVFNSVRLLQINAPPWCGRRGENTKKSSAAGSVRSSSLATLLYPHLPARLHCYLGPGVRCVSSRWRARLQSIFSRTHTCMPNRRVVIALFKSTCGRTQQQSQLYRVHFLLLLVRPVR